MIQDDKIIDLFLERDEAAIGCCKESYGKSLIRIADNVLNDIETAKDDAVIIRTS